MIIRPTPPPSRPKRPARRKYQKNTSEAITSMYDELVSAWVEDNDARTLTIIGDMNSWEKSQLFYFYNQYHYELFKRHNGIEDNTYNFINLPDNHLSIIMNSGLLNVHSKPNSRYEHDYDYISESLSMIGLLEVEQSKPVIESIVTNYLDIIGNDKLRKPYQDELAALYQVYYLQYNDKLQLLMRSLSVYYGNGEALRALLGMTENDFYKGVNKELSLGVWL